MTPTDRYVLLCNGEPMMTTADKQELVVYLWGCDIRAYPGGPFRYVVLDYEVPYVIDTGDLCAFIERLP